MNEMVERVARAVAAAEGIREAYFGDNTMRVYAPLARAAIEAMQEPTEAMCDAGSEAHGVWGFGASDAKPVFNAMIKAALSQAPSKGTEQ